MKNAFKYVKNQLYVDSVSVDSIVRQTGTPAYIYSLTHVEDYFKELTRALKGQDHLICYSVKANGNLGLLAFLAKMGCGFDIVSNGELYKLAKAGADMGKVIFAGVGKTRQELTDALKAGIYMINIESWPEAVLLDEIAGSLRKKVKVDFRINPDVDAKTHAYITTGEMENKFGMPIYQARELYARARELKNLEICGVHLHIGSQITTVGPFEKAARKALKLVSQLREDGFNIRTLNLGGGLGIVYDKEKVPTLSQFANVLKKVFRGSGLRLILEPGRSVIGNAGIMVTEVTYLKETRYRKFAIVDAGMNDLIRPSLYQAYHGIEPVIRKSGKKRVKVDVVGPICESGDFFAKDRMLPLPQSGEHLALFSAGAYGSVMASNYCGRGRGCEVLVKGKKWEIARRRESHAELIRNEMIPGSLVRK